MEWSDVRIFLAVARTGTLGAAARLLHLSHPTIGRRLRALEEATGQMLFQRTADGFVLTEEGMGVLPLAEQIEEGALAMERRLAGKQRTLDGILRITSADWFGAYVLPPVLAEYAASYPLVEIEVLTGTRLFNLAQREADVAFRIVPFEEQDIVQRRLLRMRYGVYVATASPDPVIGDGSGIRLITPDTFSGTFPDTAWLKEMFPNAGVVLQSNNRSIKAQMCAMGMGIAVLPRPLGDQVNGIRLLELGVEPPHREIWMGYHRDLRRLNRLRAFVDLAVKHLANATFDASAGLP